MRNYAVRGELEVVAVLVGLSLLAHSVLVVLVVVAPRLLFVSDINDCTPGR